MKKADDTERLWGPVVCGHAIVNTDSGDVLFQTRSTRDAVAGFRSPTAMSSWARVSLSSSPTTNQ
jgi:hypothetical protein